MVLHVLAHLLQDTLELQLMIIVIIDSSVENFSI